MTDTGQRSDTAVNKPSWRRARTMGLYLLSPIIIYPPLLMAAQDWPDFPQFTLRRVFLQTAASSPPLTWAVSALIFVPVYFLGFARFCVLEEKVKFYFAATLLALGFYLLGVHLLEYWTQVPVARQSPSKLTWTLVFSLILALHVGEALVARLTGKHAFRVPQQGRQALILLFSVCWLLAAMAAYVTMAVGFEAISELRTLLSAGFSLASYRGQGAALAFSSMLFLVIGWCIIRTDKLRFGLVGAALTDGLYNASALIVLGMKWIFAAYSAEATKCLPGDLCLMLLDHCALLSFSAAGVLALMERRFRAAGKVYEYRN